METDDPETSRALARIEDRIRRARWTFGATMLACGVVVVAILAFAAFAQAPVVLVGVFLTVGLALEAGVDWRRGELRDREHQQALKRLVAEGVFRPWYGDDPDAPVAQRCPSCERWTAVVIRCFDDPLCPKCGSYVSRKFGPTPETAARLQRLAQELNHEGP
jgi:hypothetical protein